MDSSKHSETAGSARRLLEPGRLRELSRRGYSGIALRRHRAFVTMPLKPLSLVKGGALALATTLAWLAVRPWIGRWWGTTFQYWSPWLDFEAGVTLEETGTGIFANLIPQIKVTGPAPDREILAAAALLTLAVLLVSFRLPARLTPLRYFLRVLSAIQASSVIYFFFFAQRFAHEIPGYISTMLATTMAFITFVPAILAFTYYIFDFSLLRKLSLTVLIMGHLVIFTPLQYLLHLYILASFSIVFMPVLYTLCGLLLDVMIFIALYSWGMSWDAPESTF